MNCSTPGFPVHHQLPEFTQAVSIESVMPSNHLVPFSSSPQSFPASESFEMSQLHIRWPKCHSFSFNISPSNEHPGLIFFRMDWLDLLAVQGTFKSLLQHHSSKPLILWHSALFIVQLSHPYMTTRKTIALTRWAFVGKVMSRMDYWWEKMIQMYLFYMLYLSLGSHAWFYTHPIGYWNLVSWWSAEIES